MELSLHAYVLTIYNGRTFPNTQDLHNILIRPTFSAPNYCGEFDNAGAMMSVDETLMCSFQILKPADKKKFPYGGLNSGRPITPPRGANQKKGKK